MLALLHLYYLEDHPLPPVNEDTRQKKAIQIGMRDKIQAGIEKAEKWIDDQMVPVWTSRDINWWKICRQLLGVYGEAAE